MNPNNPSLRFFTPQEIDIMLDHNVPYSVAYQRVQQLKMDRYEAITKPLGYGKGRRKVRNEASPRMLSIHELNWKR